MKITLLVAVVLAAAFATGCSGDEESPGTALGASSGDSAAAAAERIGFQQVAGTSSALPGITVVGSGSARTVPDVADWSFGVQSDADTASAALNAASEATRRIVDALRDAGIDKDDVQTEQVSLYPRTTDDGRAVIGYTASSTVHATIRDLGKAGSVIDAAVGAGANQIYGPTLRVSDSRAQYRAAVDAAFDDAKARAEALAAKAGVTLGGPIAIVESGGAPPVFAEGERLAADAAQGVPIEPGTQEIGATLTVTFAIS
ncbi:MAG: SIMPL domain-containing protein [Gaiellaceae bacterium]